MVYSFTMLVNTFFMLSDLLVSKGATPQTVMRMLVYLMPSILAMTVPMATLMGILAGISRMSSDSEVLALRTMGVHHVRLYKPVLIFSVLSWLISSLLSLFVAPEAQFQFVRLQSQVHLSRVINQIKPYSFYTELPSYVLFFESADPQTKEWRNVFLSSNKAPESDLVILAERGRFTYSSESRRSGFITLHKAHVHRFDPLKSAESYEISSYETLIEDVPDYHEPLIHRQAHHLPVHRVWAMLSQSGADLRLAIEFHNRFAFPFSVLALGLLGVSLGVSIRKGGRINGFVLSLFLIFVYYALMTLGRNLALSGAVPPFVGIWGANLFLLAAGLLAFRVTSRGGALRLDSIRCLWRYLRLFPERLKCFFPWISGLTARQSARNRFRFLRILDAYVMKRLIFSFSLIFFSLMTLIYLSKILELIDNVFSNKLPFFIIFKYMFFHTPEMISMTLPISVLTAVLLTYSLMSKQNEIVAVLVNGIRLQRILLPALCFGLIISILFFIVQETVLPQYNHKATELLDTIYGVDSKAGLHEDVQRNWVIDDSRRIFYHSGFDVVSRQFQRFSIIELEDGLAVKKRLSAESARWLDEFTLRLQNGTERLFAESRPVEVKAFAAYDVAIPGGERFFSKINNSDLSSYHMNIRQLKEYVLYLEQNQSDSTRYRAKIMQKLFYPFSSLVMVFIAIPFAFLMGRKGSMYGIGVAVSISMVFIWMIGFLNSFGNNGLMSPFLAGILPYLFFTVLSLALMSRIRG